MYDQLNRPVKPISIDIVTMKDGPTMGSKVVEYGIAWERTALSVARFILLESLKLVPIETGLLAASGKATVIGKSYSSVSRVTFATPYAVYVHGDKEAAHGSRYNAENAERIRKGLTHARRPQEQYRFLQSSIDNNQKEIRQIINLEMRRKGASDFMVRTSGYELYKDRHKERLPITRNPFKLP